MSTEFVHTIKLLEADSSRRSVFGGIAATVLLGGWVIWFFGANVTRYETTDLARLEVDRAVHKVQTPLTGRVVSCRLVLGHEVQAGDVLVELDSTPQQLQLAETRARAAALLPEIASLGAERSALISAQRQEHRAAQVGVEEATARLREAESVAELAATESLRISLLRDRQLISERDFLLAVAEARQRHAAADSIRLGVNRLDGEQQTRESDREAGLRRLDSQIQALEGRRVTTGAELRRLEHEVERRRIRAAVGGRLGDVAVVRVGAIVEEGDTLAAIVPQGALRIIAEYSPPSALGRIQPGQPGRLRLHGFSWAQYGSVRARVVTVANEIREGRVRVELALEGQAPAAVPLQHGLPGTAEIAVEDLTPATLLLRAAGRLVTSPAVARGAGVP